MNKVITWRYFPLPLTPNPCRIRVLYSCLMILSSSPVLCCAASIFIYFNLFIVGADVLRSMSIIRLTAFPRRNTCMPLSVLCIAYNPHKSGNAVVYIFRLGSSVSSLSFRFPLLYSDQYNIPWHNRWRHHTTYKLGDLPAEPGSATTGTRYKYFKEKITMFIMRIMI